MAKALLSLIASGLFLCFFISLLISAYMFTGFDTGESYSLTQKWKEYYSLQDWNLPTHAVTDIDGDGRKDLITSNHCAFLSSVKAENISSDRRCSEPGLVIIAFIDNNMIGQNFESKKPFRYNWLIKSYVVKTQQNTWKFYEMNGFQLRTFELDENAIFQEVSPTNLDRVDLFTYQLSHLGIAVYLFITSFMFQV